MMDRYPIESPKDIPCFFEGIEHRVHNQAVSRDKLDNDLLFGKFDELGLHFNLICATKGCPPIKAGAFQPG